MSAITTMVNQYLAQQQRREELEAQDRLASRSGRNQMIGTGLGALGSLGGAYLGSDAGSAALSSALGLGGASTAATTPAAGSAVLNPITSAIANAGTTAGTTGAGTMGTLGSTLGSVALPAAAMAGLYAVDRGMQGVLGDESTKPLGIAARGLVGGFMNPGLMVDAYGAVKDMFGSGGDVNTQERRDIRGDELSGFYNDGQLQFGQTDADVSQLGGIGSGGQFGSYNVDLEQAQNLDSDLAQTIGGLNPLMTLALGDRDPNRASDFTGELANAIIATGDPATDVKEAYSELGYDRDKAYTEVLNMEGLDTSTRDAYLAAIDDVFGVENPNKGKGVDAQGRLDTGV